MSRHIKNCAPRRRSALLSACYNKSLVRSSITIGPRRAGAKLLTLPYFWDGYFMRTACRLSVVALSCTSCGYRARKPAGRPRCALSPPRVQESVTRHDTLSESEGRATGKGQHRVKDWPRPVGTHTDRLRHVWFWRGGGRQRPPPWKLAIARAHT